MPKKMLFVLCATMLIFSMVLSACGPKSAMEDVDVTGTTIYFWHVWGEEDDLGAVVGDMVDEFNATNEWGITVEDFDQTDYSPLEDKVNAGIQSGDLPHIVQAYTSALNNWHLVDLVVDLEPYVYDEIYGLTEEELADIYPGVLELGVNAAGERLAWPWSQSANAMVYNHTWAQELGFAGPPANSAELKEQLCAAAEANLTDDNPDNDGGTGMVWYPNIQNLLGFVHAFGGDFMNDDGTAYEFNTPEVIAAAMYINELRDAGCTFETESYPNPEQANRLALVTLSSTNGLKYYGYDFADGAFPDDEWGFLPFVGPDGGQGADNYTQMLGVLKSTPEQELASWLFLRFLTNAENQATYIENSGYLPTHFSTEEMVADYVASVPQFESTMAIAQLGQAEPETFTAWYSVRRAVSDAAAELYAATSEEEVIAILAELDVTAAELVAEIEE